MLFSNPDFARFREVFEQTLGDRLGPDEPGAFILALANSMQDAHLEKVLSGPLANNFRQLSDRRRRDTLDGSPDDIAVLDQLMQTGLDGFRAWRTRDVDEWHCAFNPLRALRPARESTAVFSGLRQPFNDAGFHFDKPFLRPEIITEGEFAGNTLRVMYHKFPFTRYHLLIVINAAQHAPQHFESEHHQLMWSLVEHLSGAFEGIGLAYNSLGAGASINHLHVHGFVQKDLLPVEQAYWRHAGGTREYPLTCYRHDDVDRCWQQIEQLHASGQPFNLLYRAGHTYVIPRLAPSQALLPEWLPAVGWFEVCGGFNLSSLTVYESLSADDLSAALSSLRA